MTLAKIGLRKSHPIRQIRFVFAFANICRFHIMFVRIALTLIIVILVKGFDDYTVCVRSCRRKVSEVCTIKHSCEMENVPH